MKISKLFLICLVTLGLGHLVPLGPLNHAWAQESSILDCPSEVLPNSTLDDRALFLSFQGTFGGDEILKALLIEDKDRKNSPYSYWSIGQYIPSWTGLSKMSKKLWQDYASYQKSPAIGQVSRALKNLSPEIRLHPMLDIQERTLGQMIEEEKPDQNGMELKNIPFKLHQQIALDLPANPVRFEDHNPPDSPSISLRPGSHRGDMEGTGEIFQRLHQLIMKDPEVKKITKDSKVSVQQIVHQALLSRVQGFDHPITHTLYQRIQQDCPTCEPLFTNNQEKGGITFAVKGGRLFIKTSVEYLVREFPPSTSSGMGLPVHAGNLEVDRMIIVDLTTGKQSQQLIYWRPVAGE